MTHPITTAGTQTIDAPILKGPTMSEQERVDVTQDLTRPIIGIENRSAQEAFDIMADRITSAFKGGRLTAPAPPMSAVGKVIAWSYELATHINERGDYSGWQLRLSRTEPYVPARSIRNIVPLYAAPAEPMSVPGVEAASGSVNEAFQGAHALIQEAKGFAGPGTITDHLDFAESWIDKAEAKLVSLDRLACHVEAAAGKPVDGPTHGAWDRGVQYGLRQAAKIIRGDVLSIPTAPAQSDGGGRYTGKPLADASADHYADVPAQSDDRVKALDWTGGRAWPDLLEQIAQFWAQWEEDRAGTGTYYPEELAGEAGGFATELADHLAALAPVHTPETAQGGVTRQAIERAYGALMWGQKVGGGDGETYTVRTPIPSEVADAMLALLRPSSGLTQGRAA